MRKALHLILCLLVSSFFITSCSSEELDTEAKFQEIINLEVGNYWVYEKVTITEDGEMRSPKLDSVVVVEKTILEGKEVFKLKGSLSLKNSEESFIYDSLNYLKSYPGGNVIFTTDALFFEEIDNDFLEGQIQIRPNKELVSVPAGTFNSYNFSAELEAKDPNYPHGTLFSNKYFADNIGLIKTQDQYYSSGSKIEKRLLRFGKN